MSRLLSIKIPMSRDEADYIRHASKLSHMSVNEFIRRAVNVRLREMGVDAVLLAEREPRRRPTGGTKG